MFKKVSQFRSLLAIIVGVILGAGVVTAHDVNSAVPKTTSAKPAANQTVALSDEQQGVFAVRSAKASVISIVGTSGGFGQVSGTGFIIDSTGFIVSNSHVVQDNVGNYSYQVVFSDGSKLTAAVLGVDRYNDIALLKIEAGGLTPARLGDSDGLETGQTVFAIGNSLGKYQNTVTRGVVSGLGRDVSVSDSLSPRPRLQNLIQTDAAINPGNSGGPLINMNGEVVGMNTVIDTGGEGLGFAVPINTIKESVAQIRTNGKVSRPYLGITFQTIDAAIQSAKGLTLSEGALVLAISPNSPALGARLRVGDIIYRINELDINSRNQLDKVIQKFQAGNQVLVSLRRGNENLQLPLILGEFK